MSMETVKAAIKLVEAKRKIVNSLEAKHTAAVAKVNAAFEEKFATADKDLNNALEDLDAVYKTVRNGGTVVESAVDHGVEAEAV